MGNSLTYVVHVYRSEKRNRRFLVRVVEEVEVEGKRAFHTVMWDDACRLLFIENTNDRRQNQTISVFFKGAV